ncbi:MAG TPA: choice-of-anchor B family protein [Gemmatimonadales bacterium]|nr:choice-of-anchor B family protein [Gemmatimonadales bacterium]
MSTPERTLAALAAALLLSISHVPAQSSRPDAAMEHRAGFGASVAVGEAEVFVGEPNNRFRSGVVYTYRRSTRGTWQEQAQLVAPDSATGDRFGRAIAVGSTELLIGSTPELGKGAGVVHAYARSASGPWRHRQAVQPANGAAGDAFGSAIAIDGETAVVGAPGAGDGVGAAYVLHRTGGEWRVAVKLTPQDTAVARGFGSAVAIRGDRLLIGAPGSLAGAGLVQPFRRVAGAWIAEAGVRRAGAADTTAAFGGTIAMASDRAFVGAAGIDGGSGAMIMLGYDTTSTSWRVRGEMAAFDGARGSGFGSDLALSDDDLWVGAPNGRGAGTVYAYRVDGEGVVSVSAIGSPQPDIDRAFGRAVAVRGDVAVVGITGTAIGAGNGLILERRAGTWQPATPVESPPESFAAISGPEIACAEGKAVNWDCGNVDLVSFLPVSALGGVRGMRLNDLWGWTDSTTGGEYVIIGRSDGTSFVDMTDAAHPRYLGDLPMTKGSHAAVWRDMKVYRDHVYITADGAGQHGVQVFDLDHLRGIRTPQTFTEDYIYTGIASAHNMVINEETGFGYVVGASGGGTTCGGGLHMLDLHTPDHPTFVGCFSDGVTGRRKTGYSHDAQCLVYRGPDADYQGHEICLAANETAISFADVTDKANPKSIATASYPNVAYAHQGWLSEDQRFFFSNDEIDEANGSEPHTRTLVWDLSDLDDPVLVKEYFATTTETDHNLYVRGRYMYQSNTGAGFRVIDVGDPTNPVEVGYFDTDRPGSGGGTWSNYPYFRSGVVPVTAGFAGIFFVRPRLGLVP